MTASIPKILIVAGATASGKSAYALSIAEKKGGVIINADSQQIYADLRILTARPTPEEEARAPHRLYGTLPAHEICSAGKWLKFARMEIDWALSSGQLPVVTGGTGLYLKALLEGIAEIPEIPPEVHAQSMSDYAHMEKEAFIERLRAVDPAFFERLKVYDRQRLTRAWEVWLGTGRPLGWWQDQEVKPAYPLDYFDIRVMDVPRDELYRRCDARFLKMIEAGAIEEVKNLLQLKLPPDLPVMKSVGVGELSAHLAGEATLEQAVASAQQATRNYAKRQLTWFRNQMKSATRVPD
jgi:tRNA dimethylallyltransferase